MNRLFNHILRLYLVVSMWFFVPNMMSYKPQEMFIQYGAMLFFALSFIVKPIRQINGKWLFIIFLSIFLNTLLFRFDSISRMGLVNIFLGLVTIKIIAERFDLNYKAIGTMFLLFIVANLILLVLQVKNIDPIFASVHPENMPEVDHVGFMGVRFALGCLGAFALPFLYVLNPFICLLVVPLLIFSKSSSCVMACVVAMGFLSYFDIRRWIGSDKNKMLIVLVLIFQVLAMGAFYIYFFDMPTGQFMKRGIVWMTGIRYLVGTAPYIGLGLGKWATTQFVGVQENGQLEGWKWAHNEFIQFAFEQGIIGISLLFWWIWEFVKGVIGKIEQERVTIGAFIGLMIICMFHFPFHARFVGISLFIVALMIIQMSGEKHEKAIIDCDCVASI